MFYRRLFLRDVSIGYATAHYTVLLILPGLTCLLLGWNLDLRRYSLYCLYVAPLYLIRRFLSRAENVGALGLVGFVLYGFGLGAVLVWAILGGDRN